MAKPLTAEETHQFALDTLKKATARLEAKTRDLSIRNAMYLTMFGAAAGMLDKLLAAMDYPPAQTLADEARRQGAASLDVAVAGEA